MASVVYFIRLGKNGPVKIGYSANLKKRVRTIGMLMPDHLVVEATLPGGRELELRLHQALHASRRRNEWFNSTHDVNAVISIARMKGGDAIARWLDRKACERELRGPAVDATEDFSADIRFLTAMAFKLAVAKHGGDVVAEAVGKAWPTIKQYASGRIEPTAAAFLNLNQLDPGACAPLFARCEKRASIDALLGKMRIVA